MKRGKVNIYWCKTNLIGYEEGEIIMVLINILLIIILIFVLGNLILAYLLRKSALRYMPIGNFAPGDTRLDVMDSKIDLLNKRVTKLENDLRYKKKK